MGYQEANGAKEAVDNVTEETAITLNILALAAIADQDMVVKLMASRMQLVETNWILMTQVKALIDTHTFSI